MKGEAMLKRKFTVVSQLHETNNMDIIHYFEEARFTYAKAVRQSFHIIKNTSTFNKSHYNTALQSEFGILKRTANSIISDAQGRLNALKELKQFEKNQLAYKIESLEQLIERLQQQKITNTQKLQQKKDVSLIKHRNLKRKLVAKKAKLNRLTQKYQNLLYQINNNKYKLCFGSKRLLQSDYQAFVEQRDSQIAFVGSKSETSSNQMLQLTFNSKKNQFQIKLRKDFGGFKSSDDKYAYGQVYFNNHKNIIKHILRDKNSPLSFKIIKKNKRYYLYCTFEIQVEPGEFKTRSTYGTIGLDFNKGFVTLSETNQYGHLVQTQLLPYRFKSGHKTTTDLQQIAKQIITLAVETGKDICIENLDFAKTKAKAQRGQDEKYNEMLHSLAYKQFVDSIEQCGYRHLVYTKRVNPAWTSWLAKQKYCPTMKLNIHIGASYVIARRGQGYTER